MADIHSASGGYSEYTATRRISWGAVFAGTVVALVIYFMLNLLGVGIGLGSVSLTQGGNQAEGLGIGAAIWAFLAMIIALFVGGWASGRISGIPFRSYSVTHGLITFSLFTIVSLYVLTTGIGSIISGAGGLMGQAMSAMGPNAAQTLGAGEAVQNVDPQQAVQTAEGVREAVSSGAIYGFIALVLGAVAAAVGGLLAAPKRSSVSGNLGNQPI